MAVEEICSRVMVVGVDGSSFGYDALKWTLRRFFSAPPHTAAVDLKLVVIHAKPNAASVVGYTELGSAYLFSLMESNLQKMADFVVAKTKELCLKYKVDNVQIEVIEGDARYVLCDAAHRHHATTLILGSHGLGAFNRAPSLRLNLCSIQQPRDGNYRALLGSVSDYCSHNANCSVLIVKNGMQKP